MEQLATHPDDPYPGRRRLVRARSLRAKEPPGSLSHGERYRYLRAIKVGPMSTLYEALQVLLDRRVAVKVLPAEATPDADRVARFLREARLLASLRHPNIVEVFELDSREDGALCIVEELLAGEDLESLLSRRPRLDLDEALEIVQPVMGALVAAHRLGVVHRDLKPANIFLAREPHGTRPTLLDFGLARIAREALDRPALTGPGQILGSPLYMAPEQFLAPGEVDARADVWAMGVVLYEMLAGVAPFDAPSAQAVMVRIAREEPAPLASLRPDLPERVAGVIHAALAKDPAARHRSMQSFLGALLDCPQTAAAPSVHAVSEPTHEAGAADEVTTQQMPRPSASDASARVTSEDSRPWWKPRPTLVTGMVVGAVTLALALAILAIRSGPTGSS